MKPIKRILPPISYIVARSNPGGVIGCENNLPWKIRTDLRFFKSVTEGHAIIMGRRTLESLGRALPNRMNIVLSSRGGTNSENLFWAKSKEDALFMADLFSIINEKAQIIVIGGAQIYGVFKDLFTKIYLTEVNHKFDCGDAYFTEKFDLREWDLISKKDFCASDFDEYDFSISVMEKKNKYTPHRKLEEFLIKEKSDLNKSDFELFARKFKDKNQLLIKPPKFPLMVA